MANRHCILLPFSWELPTPGLWNKTGIFGNNINADGVRRGWQVSLVAAIPVFYRCSVSRSPYRTISWFSTWSQLRYLCVHFFTTFSLARYSIFSNAVSLGNTLFVLVTFRYCRFNPSMILVVLSRNRYSTTYTDKKTIPTFFGKPAVAGIF